MTISYIERDGQDRLCGITYAETLRMLVRENVITQEKCDELLASFAPVTCTGNTFINTVRKLIGLEEDGVVIVRFVSIK